jgi:phosphate transport system substrate-binding protein
MRAAAALLAAVAMLAVATDARAAPTITLSGQQITEALVADLAYFYRHAVRHPPRFDIRGGGTSGGIADTARGIVDGGLVSRDLAADDPPGLVLTPVALSGVCLVSNHVNPLPSLSRAQLQDIVAGRVTSWSQVPGAARADPIVPVALDQTTGAARVFDSVFLDDATAVAWHPVTLLMSTQVRDYVKRTPAALGYLDLVFTPPVHVIAFEGVGCTQATIRAGTYPARRPLGVVTRGRPRGPLARFLRWIRTSRTARRVIATHYVPLARRGA